MIVFGSSSPLRIQPQTQIWINMKTNPTVYFFVGNICSYRIFCIFSYVSKGNVWGPATVRWPMCCWKWTELRQPAPWPNIGKPKCRWPPQGDIPDMSKARQILYKPLQWSNIITFLIYIYHVLSYWLDSGRFDTIDRNYKFCILVDLLTFWHFGENVC